jgi:hypothetical protein
MERSGFERLSDANFKKYITYFNKITKDMEYSDLDDFYQWIMYTSSDLTTKIGSPVGIRELSRLDIEYLYFYLETGRRPQLESKTVNFVTEERIKVRYTRTGDIETYAIGAVDENYLSTLRSEDQIDPWEWDTTDEDERDSDLLDDWFEA